MPRLRLQFGRDGTTERREGKKGTGDKRGRRDHSTEKVKEKNTGGDRREEKRRRRECCKNGMRNCSMHTTLPLALPGTPSHNLGTLTNMSVTLSGETPAMPATARLMEFLAASRL